MTAVTTLSRDPGRQTGIDGTSKGWAPSAPQGQRAIPPALYPRISVTISPAPRVTGPLPPLPATHKPTKAKYSFPSFQLFSLTFQFVQKLPQKVASI